MMAQMQQDLKGDRFVPPPHHQIHRPNTLLRSTYYASSDLDVGRNLGLLACSAYFHRLYHFYRHSLPQPPATDPYPIFTSMLSALQAATEEALSAKMSA